MSPFESISPNPFIVGNAVRDPSMFFGREAEFSRVQKRFSESENGSLMVFCGERRSGKTSILLQIQQGRLGPEYVPVLIDMQAMAVQGEVEFFTRICSQISKQLGGPDQKLISPEFGDTSKPSATFLQFIDSVLEQHPSRKLVLLFDEYELFEDKIDSGALTMDVLLILSSLMESSPVYLVFTGSQHVEERQQEYWGILHKAHEYRHISYLDPEDAVRLVQDPVQGRVTYSDGLVDRIIRQTAGHPFYTQAVCQRLVDVLNEERSNTATDEMVTTVVDQIVQNPFPQMTFLWETLERDQKLALALLAQALEDDAGFASAKELVQSMRQGGYPLRLDHAALATSLEALFQQEFLTKNREREPGYAFRMELWRQWIRRMHTVWRVMREEGLISRGAKRKRRRIVTTALLGAGAVAAGFVIWNAVQPPREPVVTAGSGPRVPAPAVTGVVSLEAQPSGAAIYLDGTQVAVGSYRRPIAADQEHSFKLEAVGYVDSTVAVRVAEAESATVAVSLRPERGAVRIEAEPASALIFLNGKQIGIGAAAREQLAVPEPHVVEARLDGYHTERRSVRVLADSTVDVALRLSPVTVSFSLVTAPDGAEIFVDGVRRGASPLVVSDVPVGRHRFEARLPGHVASDTTLIIDASTTNLRLDLEVEPPGILVVRGDRPARIYIDDRQIGSGELPSSGKTSVEAGSHTVEVVFRDGSTDAMTVTVLPNETVELLWAQQKLSMPDGSR